MFNPSRLTLARHRRGLTKTELARRARLTPRTISTYENEGGDPPPKSLETLAEELSFPIDFFFGPTIDTPMSESASFRSLSRMTAAQEHVALAAGGLCIELEHWLSRRFDLPAIDIPALDRSIVDPESAAMMVRAGWGLGTAPIANMVHLLEAHGVRVFSLVEDSREVDAFSFWHRGTPFVCLNTLKSAEHGVFDAAHELGHLVLHRGHATSRGREEETEANAFASALLMPKDDLFDYAPRFPGLEDVIAAKSRWRVSALALCFRMRRLKMISDWHYRELCTELSRSWSKREPKPIAREHSQLLAKAFAMLKQEGVSRREVASELHLFADDLEALVFGLVMSSVAGEGRRGGAKSQEAPVLRIVPPNDGQYASPGG